MLRAFPPSTETVPRHPESQATERRTVAAAGVSTRTSSDFVVLEMTSTGSVRPSAVVAEIGVGGFCRVNTA